MAGVKGNWQDQSIFKSVFSLDKNKRSYYTALDAHKDVFNVCKIPLSQQKKVNLSRSPGMNRADDFGAELLRNDQRSSHDVKGRKNQSHMRQDPHQIKHVNSGHFFSPQFETHWIDRSHLIGTQEFEKLVFPLEEWRRQINSENGDHTQTANDFVHREIPFGARVIVQDGKLCYLIK